ncbi:MAG: hypothetical protein ACM3PF_07870 [Bacteroidota bacterium]
MKVGAAARWAALVAVLLAVALIRFDLRDPGPIRRLTAGATATRYGLPLDVAGYVRLTAYFRGEVPSDSLIPPFCYRPLVPLAASVLPWSPLTSIDLIDLACLVLTLVALDRLLRHAGYETLGRTTGCLLFAVSFPTFYYGAIGFLDPVVVLTLAGMALAALRGRRIAFAAWLVIGVLAKETDAIMAALPGLWAWSRGEPLRSAVRVTAPFALLAVAIAVALRTALPFPEQGWLWVPHARVLLENLARPRAVLSLLLTLGLPALLAAAALATGRAARALGGPALRFFLAGAALVSLLYAVSLFAAWADGRVIWGAHPFLIPIAVALVDPSGAARPAGRTPSRAAA